MKTYSAAAAFLMVLFSTTSSSAVANPSHKAIDAVLPIHGTLSAPPWHREATRLYEDARNKLQSYLEKEKKNAIKTIRAEDLGKTHLMITMMRRGGTWLEVWGEPAGSDLVARAQVMQTHLGRIIGASQAFPATQKYIENFRAFLVKTGPARTKALMNIEKLCNEQKWQAAETALFKVYDTLEPGIVFLSPEERKPIYIPFIEVDTAIRTAMARMRAEASAAELSKAVAELKPDYAVALQEVQGAVNAFAMSGTATWREASVTGPQLIEKIGDSWRETQVRAHQYRGKSWALQYRLSTGGAYHESMVLPGQIINDPIAQEFDAFSQQITESIAQVVQSAGAKVSPDSAGSTYAELLRAVAPLSRQVRRPEFTARMETALNAFRTQAPGLASQVTAYAAATDDLLRWRARVAGQQAAARSSDYASLSQRFRDGTMSGKIDGVDYVGLFVPTPSEELQPQLMAAAPDTMTVAVERLLGQKAIIEDIVRIAPDSKAAIGRYQKRAYATVTMPLAVQEEVAALKADLMVSDSTPPLTLAAMQALVSAERNDMAAIGGEITGTHLEAVITRFATLPATASLLTTLGQLPPEKFDGSNLRNMLMRFEIAPRWARHEYFFVEFTAPPPNLTALR